MRERRALQHGPIIHSDGTTTFRLWAPRAEAVHLVVAGDEHDLIPAGGGWFAARLPGVDGDRYALRLDGGPERPDPAARALPEGVHAAGALVDPTRFDWGPHERTWRPPPLERAVIYELHVGTFTPEGTFAAAVDHLGELADLGVTHVEVMPVNAFNGPRGWGYDGVAWWAVHESYGGPAAFATFVDACHRSGIGVILDVVYNHLGPSGNYLPELGPYLTDFYATPWGPAVNLDGPGSDAVRSFIIDNARMWLADYHVDGLRLDAVHGLVDTSAGHILADLATAVDTLGAATGVPRTLIGESDRCDPATITARIAGGMGLAAQWSDDLHHALHTAVTGEDDGYYQDYEGLPDVARCYRSGWLFDGHRYSPHRARTPGAPLPDHVPGWRLVACVQNHDQVGNRAHGERLDALVEPDLARAAVALLCAAPHTPMLFMGDEFAATNPFRYFTSHPEDDLATAVREGRRREFADFSSFHGEEVPDPQDAATFARSVLDRAAADHAEGAGRRRLWRDLLALRRTHAALGDGRRTGVRVLEASTQWLAIRRDGEDGSSALVTANLHPTPLQRTVAVDGEWRALLCTDAERYGGTGHAAVMSSEGPVRAVTVPARTAVLWAPVR